MALSLGGLQSCHDEDDLEYHVTFPSPTPRTSAESDDFVYVGDEEKEPVVVLLGWAGCQDKNLAKYIALYEIKGCITIRYIPPAHDIIFRPSKFERVALKLLELLSDLSLEEHPVIFHMFSNGGCVVYRYISELVAKDTMNTVHIIGCVFDSGPAITSLMGTTRAMVAITSGSRRENTLVNSLYRLAMGVLTFVYLALVGAFEYAMSFIWKQQQRELFRVGLWHSLANERPTCPQLFMYSKADEICNWMSIRKFLEFRKSRGVLVRSMCWDNSPHVGHLVVHTEAYTKHVHDFVDECLRKTK